MDSCLPNGTKLNADLLNITSLDVLSSNLSTTKENLVKVTGSMLGGASKNPAGLLNCIQTAKALSVGGNDFLVDNLNITLGKDECQLVLVKAVKYNPCLADSTLPTIA